MKVKFILPEWPERLRHFTYAAWKKLEPMWDSPQDRPEQSPPQVGEAEAQHSTLPIFAGADYHD